MGKIFRKYGWPDNLSIIRELDDETLKKLWKNAPDAKTDHEKKCSLRLCDELVSRDLL